MTPREWREKIRANEWTKPTPGLAEGHAQANLVVLPSTLADAFEEFCAKNPRACPLLERLPPGQFMVGEMAPGADIRTDLPRYFVYGGGHLVAETTSVLDWWAPDLVAFLVGCSFTFEWALQQAGVPMHHLEQERNVSMYRTNIPLRPAGPFSGTMVVSMRWIPADKVDQTIAITSRYPRMHGRPIHMGDPRAIGIKDLMKPDFGDPVEPMPNTVPVFWACGVTTQVVPLSASPWRMICHAPGHMLILDKKHGEFEEAAAQ
ncbi:MAG: putative hydro-lyase [Armatimonadetes bacterium]|nr:putative hydro-lyase [Armatimonadota bacterium]